MFRQDFNLLSMSSHRPQHFPDWLQNVIHVLGSSPHSNEVPTEFLLVKEMNEHDLRRGKITPLDQTEHIDRGVCVPVG